MQELLSSLTRLTPFLRRVGYTRLQRIPILRRSLFKMPFEPLTTLAWLAGRTDNFTPTALPGLYLLCRTAGRTDLRTLFRLFFLNAVIREEEVERVLPDTMTRELEKSGALVREAGHLRSPVRLVPYGDLILACDPDEGADRQTDLYVYAGGDSVLLASFLSRRLGSTVFSRGLDLCSGTGFQALSMAGRCGSVHAAEITRERSNSRQPMRGSTALETGSR